MRMLVTGVLLALLVGVHIAAQAGAGMAQGPPRDAKVTSPRGTASIKGRVTTADSGIPLRRALVHLSGSGRPARAAYTDDDGRYVFTQLPAGTYTISVNPGPQRAGYESAMYGGSFNAAVGGATALYVVVGRGAQIELTAGQQLESVDVALPRAAVIAGRVTDASGEPAARVQVQALLIRPGNEPSAAGNASTNDLGEFRMFNLRPGDYIVSASPPYNPSSVEIEGDAVGFAPSYAPGVPSIADAARIRLERGIQATADMRLIETRVYTLSGSVMTAAGDLARGGQVTLVRGDSVSSSFSAMFSTSLTQTGTFTIRNVPPGSYELMTRNQVQNQAGIPAAASDVEFARMKIDVAGNVEQILIVTSSGAVISGEAVFEGGGFPPDGRVNIDATPTENRPMNSPPPARVEISGARFTMRGVFGSLLIRGNASGGTQMWTMKSVLLRGKDITDEATVFTAADSGHLQVVFTSQAPSLEGVLTAEDGKAPPEAMVIIFGQDPKSWVIRSSFTRTMMPGKDGKFVMRGLREGRYFAAAVPLDVMATVGQPAGEFLEALSAAATPVTLNAGDTQKVTLGLVRYTR